MHDSSWPVQGYCRVEGAHGSGLGQCVHVWWIDGGSSSLSVSLSCISSLMVRRPTERGLGGSALYGCCWLSSEGGQHTLFPGLGAEFLLSSGLFSPLWCAIYRRYRYLKQWGINTQPVFHSLSNFLNQFLLSSLYVKKSLCLQKEGS